jgi:hypothetical protein
LSRLPRLKEGSQIQKANLESLFADTDNHVAEQKKTNKFKVKVEEFDANGNVKGPVVDTSKSIIIPGHVFLCSNLYFYVPIDRAMCIMKIVFDSAGIR